MPADSYAALNGLGTTEDRASELKSVTMIENQCSGTWRRHDTFGSGFDEADNWAVAEVDVEAVASATGTSETESVSIAWLVSIFGGLSSVEVLNKNEISCERIDENLEFCAEFWRVKMKMNWIN